MENRKIKQVKSKVQTVVGTQEYVNSGSTVQKYKYITGINLVY
jgi:hypothetical protein